MAITDVCKIEVNEQMDEFLKEGLTLRKAAIRLAKMYSESLGTDIKPETIRKKDARVRSSKRAKPGLGTDVPTENTADIPRVPEKNLWRDFETAASAVQAGFQDLQTIIEDAQTDGWKQIPRKVMRRRLDVLNTAFDTLMEIVPISDHEHSIEAPDPVLTEQESGEASAEQQERPSCFGVLFDENADECEKCIPSDECSTKMSQEEAA